MTPETAAVPGPAPEGAYLASDRMPRQLDHSLYWLGGCSHVGKWSAVPDQGWRHEPISSYLVLGDEHALLVDTGHFAHWKAMERQLDQVLGDRPLRYIFPTHQEIPHAGNLERLLVRYPDSVVVGDVHDYHLHVPWVSPERLRPMAAGQSVDLGGEQFTFLDPIWFDLRTTLWGTTARSRALFTADAMDFAHRHGAEHCGLTSAELALADVTLHDRPGVGAWFWMRQQPMEARVAAFRSLMDRCNPMFVCSSHGAPIVGDVEVMVDAILGAVTLVGDHEAVDGSGKLVRVQNK